MKYDIIHCELIQSNTELESFFEMKYDIIFVKVGKYFNRLESFFEMKYDIMSSLYFLVQQGNTDISLKKTDSKRLFF